MADLKYTVEIDTLAAQRSLSTLSNQITGFASAFAGAFAFRELTNVSSRFEDLRTTLQLLYKDAGTGAAAFNDIKKFASESIFSVENLTETVVKLKAAGLDPTVKQLRLFADVSSVAADSVGALQAITDLYARTTAGGLGLEDLNRLADRGIPVFTILSERLGLSRLEISKIGQTAEGAQVILKALEDGLTEAFGGASANRANNVSQAISNLKDSLSNAADAAGQAGLNAGLSALIRSFTDLVNAIRPAVEVIGGALGSALQFLSENLRGVIYGATTFLAIFAVGRIVAVVKAVYDLAKGMAVLNAVFAAGPWGRFAALAGALVGTLVLLFDEIKKLTGQSKELGESKGFQVFKDGELGAGAEDLKAKVAALNQELNKFKVEMNAVVESFARYNANARDALNLETSLLGTSRENQALRRNELEINNRLAQEIARLTEQKAKLTEEERKQGRAAIIDQTIKKLQAQAEEDKKSMAAAIAASEAAQKADSLRLFGLKSQEETNRNIRKIQDDMAKITMPEIQRIEYDILAAARERAMSEIEAEQVKRGSLLTDAEKEAYMQRAIAGTKEQVAAARQLYEGSRTFSAGWAQAFNEYVDNAFNAARQAQTIFNRFTSGVEDLFVNLFKTGKFGWKEFLASLTEELLRSQIRQLIAKTFSINQGGGGGLFGGAIIPGILAEGGPAAMGRPYIVGERGPELFVPASNGTVVPNSGLGGATNVVYNINAVDAMSFKQMIARDPGFIHAVAMQGASSIPRR